MHAGVCVAIGVALAAAVQSHNLKNSPHFYSLHSWLGITAIGFYYLQVSLYGSHILYLVENSEMRW